MKLNLPWAELALASVALSSSLIFMQPVLAEDRGGGMFFCDNNSNPPATKVRHPGRGELIFVTWIREFAPGSKWTPNERCVQVSRKLQENQVAQTLNYMVPGKAENGLLVLCASRTMSSEVISCPDERILMTFRQGDNLTYINTFIQRIADVNTGRSSTGPGHSATVVQKNGSVKGIDVNVMLRYLQSDECPNGRGALGTCL